MSQAQDPQHRESSNGFGTDEPRIQNGRAGAWMRFILLLGLAGAIGYTADSAYRAVRARAGLQEALKNAVRSTGLIEPAAKTLDPKFTDQQGRLLADPPASAADCVDPQELVVAHIDSTDAENPGTSWAKFDQHLAQITGKKVVDQSYDNSVEQMGTIEKGKIQIIALHAADTPFLVNHYGFQPVAVLGSGTGANGNRLDIVVPARSSIVDPAGLKGHSLVCTVPSSITGYRAAIALLSENQGLRPNVDYYIVWSLGQRRSIEGLIQKTYDAGAVSDDKLKSLAERGKISDSDYRIVYQSEVIPRTTIGYFYNLNPDLASKVKQAILSFVPDAAAKAKDSDEDAGPELRFIPIDYKQDFKLVREIDDRFDPRFNAHPPSRGVPSTQPVTSMAQ